METIKQQPNIILTGFMGTGKTTVGILLAEALGYSFVDTDLLIEERSGRSILQIFAESGEEGFRQLEHEVSSELAQQAGLVIATGGGLITNAKNVKALSGSGQFYCLTATPAEILKRVTLDPKRIERPLLQVDDPAGRIQTLLDQRANQYGQFPQIDTSGKQPRQIASEIITHFQNPRPTS